MGLFDKFKKRGDPQLQALLERLASSDPAQRAAAARELGELGDRASAAQSALEEAIADEDGEVCLAASDALSKIRRATL